jgi:hypothetical protein
MPDFTRIIHLAYQRILGRSADLGGLENYNGLMNRGLSEAAMRESLLRSAEYAEKNPDPGVGARTSAPGRKTRKKKSGKSGRRSKPRK